MSKVKGLVKTTVKNDYCISKNERDRAFQSSITFFLYTLYTIYWKDKRNINNLILASP